MIASWSTAPSQSCCPAPPCPFVPSCLCLPSPHPISCPVVPSSPWRHDPPNSLTMPGLLPPTSTCLQTPDWSSGCLHDVCAQTTSRRRHSPLAPCPLLLQPGSLGTLLLCPPACLSSHTPQACSDVSLPSHPTLVPAYPLVDAPQF